MSALPGEHAAPVTVSVAGAAPSGRAERRGADRGTAAVGRWVGTVDRRGRVAAVELVVRPDGTVALITDVGFCPGTWRVGERPGVFTWDAVEELVEDGVPAGRIRVAQTARVAGDELASTGSSVVLGVDGTVLREVEAVLTATRVG